MTIRSRLPAIPGCRLPQVQLRFGGPGLLPQGPWHTQDPGSGCTRGVCMQTPDIPSVIFMAHIAVWQNADADGFSRLCPNRRTVYGLFRAGIY